MSNKGFEGFNQNEVEKLSRLSKNDSTEQFLDTLVQSSAKGGLLEFIEREIPTGTKDKDAAEIRKRLAIEDLNIFLDVANGMDTHIDTTAESKEKGKIDITSDLAQKLKIVIPQIENLIVFLKKQTLEQNENQIIRDIEKRILGIKIYSQAA